MTGRSARWCGAAVALLCLGCSSSNNATAPVPTNAPARTNTSATAPATTTSEPSTALRSRSLCRALTARLGFASASAPSSSFQGHRVVFAGRDLTARLLTAHDAFSEQLSPLDRQILAVSKTPVGQDAFDARLNASALDWTPTEIQELRASLAEAERAAAAAHVTFRLPATVYVAKESAAIYSGSAYTRCSAVFLPAPQPAAVLIHELYHVMSRNNPQIRRELYALVGYRPCRVSRSSLGADLKDVVITNPDTDAFGETCITLPDATGRPVTYLPLLIGNAPYDGTPPGWTIILDPILVALHGNRPVVRDGKTKYREMITPDYMRAVGENGSSEPFHPEELIALNLQQSLIPNAAASQDFPNAQLLDAVRTEFASLG